MNRYLGLWLTGKGVLAKKGAFTISVADYILCHILPYLSET